MRKYPRDFFFERNIESPLNELIRSAKTLESAKADFIIMPCHTAHLWAPEIQKEISIPLYSIIDNTVNSILSNPQMKDKKILLLATRTTVQGKLYQKGFANTSVQLVLPDQEEQKVVDSVLLSVKAGKTKNNPFLEELRNIVNKHKIQGVNALLGCCTEIPLIFPYLKVDLQMIDPTLLLAKMAIDKARSGG